MTPDEEFELAFYQLRIVVPENKFDEFIESLLSLSSGIRKEQGCLDFSLYRNLEKQDVYSVIGKWKTRQAMEKHFNQKFFPVLIGAAKVLGKDFEMNISETLEKGSYQLAKEKIDTASKERQNERSISDMSMITKQKADNLLRLPEKVKGATGSQGC